jgi:enoyl-CoA hydratase/carnithine racemase
VGVTTGSIGKTGDMAELLTLERRPDGVALIILANGKVNALSTALLAEIRDAARALTDDPAGAVVITGGDRLFAAGADISQFGGTDEAAIIGAAFHDALDAVAAIPRFVIAAVSGYALGGGCELALACDYRIASEKAVFGQPEILLGIIPGGGGTQRLPRLVGASRAKEMCLTGRQVRAEEALRIGLADEIVAPETLTERALALAAEVAAGPSSAQAICKQVIDDGLDRSLAGGLELERAGFVYVFHTDDSRTGVASFLEHGPGKATFTGK